MSENQEHTKNPSHTDSSQNDWIAYDVNFLIQNWSTYSEEKQIHIFKELSRVDAEELFLSLKPSQQVILFSGTSQLEKRSWVRLLAPDDAADLIQEMGMDSKDEILPLLDPQTRREVSVLLAYAEDKAGGLMNSRFVRLRPEMSVDEAISYIRIQSKTHVETIYYAYVLDSDQKLLGVVSFRALFSSTADKKISEIMTTDLVKISLHLDQEEVGRLFSQHEFMALPVINEQGRMEGIVTFDDIASAIQDEATEDIHKIGAVETLDAPYLQSSILEMLRKRGGWLMLLFLGEMFTATAMGFFQTEIEKAVMLAYFIPLIISSGGNSGSQATTLIIRAISLGEIRLQDWWRVLGREVISGFGLGALLGLVGFVRVLLWPNHENIYGEHFVLVAMTVSGALVCIVLWGTVVGSMLPFLLKKFKLDPASASAPAVATVVDVTGLVIYFSVAKFFLGGILF